MGNEGAIHVLPLVSEFTARKGTSLATTGYESLYCAQATRVAYMKEEQSSPPHTMLHSARHTHSFSGMREDCWETGHFIFFWPFSPLPGYWNTKQKTLFSTAMTVSFHVTESLPWDQHLLSERNRACLGGLASWQLSSKLVNKNSENTTRGSRQHYFFLLVMNKGIGSNFKFPC